MSVNRYPGTCPTCGHRVAAEAGVLIGSRGNWGAQHNPGECPSTVIPAAAARARVHAVPALGYYVRADGAAIKVVETRHSVTEDGSKRRIGKVFTPARVAGKRPSWDYVRGAGVSVADLRPMDAADAAALGLAHGHCIECCAPLGGKTESAQCAAIIGYGEICAGNNGWPFPKGVAAQRAVIARKGFDQYREPTRGEALSLAR